MGHHHNFRSARPRRSASTRAQVRQRTDRMLDACQLKAALDDLHHGFLSEILDGIEDEL